MTAELATFQMREEHYDAPAAQQLIAAVQLEYVARYGGPDETPVDPTEFTRPQGVFAVGYLDGRPAATGGLRLTADGDAEVKRMYVVPEARGRGIARAVLRWLEETARELGATRAILETGSRQPEAIGLYESSGYEPIPKYGFYRCAPGSRCYGKPL